MSCSFYVAWGEGIEYVKKHFKYNVPTNESYEEILPPITVIDERGEQIVTYNLGYNGNRIEPTPTKCCGGQCGCK
jgi:hypothetical protein